MTIKRMVLNLPEDDSRFYDDIRSGIVFYKRDMSSSGSIDTILQMVTDWEGDIIVCVGMDEEIDRYYWWQELTKIGVVKGKDWWDRVFVVIGE